jgi:hypothetical protein
MSKSAPPAPTVAQVVAQNAKRLRDGRKVELVARAARLAGLDWGTGRIADLEAGRVSPTLPTLIALCWTFSDLLNRPVNLSELLAGKGYVTLLPNVIVPIGLLHRALAGPVAGPPTPLELARRGFPMAGLKVDPSDVRADALQRVERSMLEADYRMAHSVGIPTESAAAQMQALWGRPFTAERDHRASPADSPQKRGRISRDLKAELQKAIDRGND